MKKMDVDIVSYMKSGLMGLVGLIAWMYSNSKGISGEGMELIKTLSIMFLIISVLGIAITKYFSKRPLKSTGVINKNDEMFVEIRAKSAKLTLDILNVIAFLFIILTGTQIVTIELSMYWIGIIVFVGINIISIISTFIQSNRIA
ncbi:hypothetical protein SH2C18_27920 [Clostridium sediminicola]|uniref:hypothetical protein n=1 Tax=Clostridium sediminicola TaxID=3114879 RepID=UPI0031F20F40